MNLKEPKEFLIDGKTYLLSKFDAWTGREIIAKYPLSSLPKLGDYVINEQTMAKLMSYVAVVLENGTELRLTTKDLINNHIVSWESLVKIEIAMLEYNCSFFQNGRISTFFENFAQKLPQWISKTLTDSLAPLLRKEKPPSTN